jgi:hypothetical protein
MAEELLPSIAGMVQLRHKKQKTIQNHFPVDAREIMTQQPNEFEIVDNGSMEAGRVNANPLRAAEAGSGLTLAEITGVGGSVMVAMSPEDAEAWKARYHGGGGAEKPEVKQEDATSVAAQNKTAEAKK